MGTGTVPMFIGSTRKDKQCSGWLGGRCLGLGLAVRNDELADLGQIGHLQALLGRVDRVRIDQLGLVVPGGQNATGRAS